MTTGFVLIVAILVLGGVIAIVGDRIGMKVGKARLTLFNLRPRQTATVVSVATGSVISASTLAILFGVSSQLRTGVFELRRIQNDLAEARNALLQVREDKEDIEQELVDAQAEQLEVQRRLRDINRSLNQAIARQEATEAQLNQTQNQLGQVEQSFEQAQRQLRSLSQQEQRLREAVRRLQADRQVLLEREAEIRQQIAERDEEIAERDEEIAARDNAIARQKTLLQELETQQSYLTLEVERLEREAQGLRQGNVALLRNQTLALAVFRVVQAEAAPQVINQLLREANRVATRSILPGTTNYDDQIVRISSSEVEQLVEQISDGNEYVVRILSAANYVVGEPCVIGQEDPCIQVFADAVENRVVFQEDEIIATTPIELSNLADRQLVERLTVLIATSQFRARQAGVVADTVQVADGRTESVIRFLEQVQRYGESVTLQAVAADNIQTAGPIRIDLAAVQNGRLLFRTGTSPTPPVSPSSPF